jgi:hypothetical protein
MIEAIINLQTLLVKSDHHRKAFPVGYHGAQILRPASRYSARRNAVRRDCLLWVINGPSVDEKRMSGFLRSGHSPPSGRTSAFHCWLNRSLQHTR